MNETMKKGLVAAALALLAGCLSDHSAIAVSGFTTVATGEGACVPSSVELVGGLMDTTRTQAPHSRAYRVGVRLENNLLDNADSELRKVNTHTVDITSLKISYRAGAGASFVAPAPVTAAVAIILPPGGSNLAVVDLVSNAVAEKLDGVDGEALIVTLEFSGKTRDGGVVAAAPIEFPIELCAGCLGAPCAVGEQVKHACSIAQADGIVCEALPGAGE